MMKKVALLIGFLLIIQNANSITSDLQDSYEQKETIIGELFGEILQPISKEQVKLVRDQHIDAAFEYDIKKLNDRYYIWLIAPERAGNYTLIIGNIATRSQGITQIENYEKSFLVRQNLTDYSIKPGFVLSAKDFEIIATLYQDSEKFINVDFPYERQIKLNPGNNRIRFSIIDIKETQFTKINTGKYAVPAYIIVANDDINDTNNRINDSEEENNFTENDTAKNLSVKFKFMPEVIDSIVLVSEFPRYAFKIVNEGEEKIENLELNYDKEKFIVEPEKNIDIRPNGSVQFNLSVLNFSEEVRGAIIADYKEASEYLLVRIRFTTNRNDVSTRYDNDNSDEVSSFYCSELAGVICSANEKCEGEEINSLNGLCCLSRCKKDDGENKYLIGYIIIAVVILFMIAIYLKYKRTKPEKKLLK